MDVAMTVTILVIEDEPATCDLIVGYLSRRGHHATGCATLAEAEKALIDLRPDVVVSDIRMPDGNGTTFCLNNAGRVPRARWLLMSSNEDLLRQSRTLMKAGDAPPYDVIDKPVSMRTLDEFIRLATYVKASARPGSEIVGHQADRLID